MKQPRLSLCMIVKNEAENLKVLLPQAKKFADEIVIVDTGSDDNTKKIARNFTPHVYDFKWIDDFASARNFALSRASGDYFVWLDADDRVPEPSIEAINKLKNFFDGKKYFYFELRDIRDRGKFYGTGVYASLKQIRCAPLREDVRFEGRIHESLTNSLERNNYIPVSTDIIIEHYGYDDPKLLKKKIRRNLKILLLEKPYRASDISFAILLARTYESLGMYREAYEELNSFITKHYPSIADKYLHVVFELYMLLAELAYKNADKDKSLRWLLKAMAFSKEDKISLFRAGLLWERTGKFSEAIKNFTKIPEAPLIISTMSTIHPPDVWEILLRIAFCYLCMGKTKLYEHYLNKAIETGISHPLAYEWMAYHAVDLGKLEISKRILVEACTKGFFNESIYRMLGEIHSLTGEYEKAERFYKLSMQIAPDSQETEVSFGWHHLRCGNIGQAYGVFQRLLKTGKDDWNTLVGYLITSFMLRKDYTGILEIIQERMGSKESGNSLNTLKALVRELQAEGKPFLIPYITFMMRKLLKYNRQLSDYLSERR